MDYSYWLLKTYIASCLQWGTKKKRIMERKEYLLHIWNKIKGNKRQSFCVNKTFLAQTLFTNGILKHKTVVLEKLGMASL